MKTKLIRNVALAITLLALLLLLVPRTGQAATRYSCTTGNWNSTSTWAASTTGACGQSVPTSADDVVIYPRVSATTVTVTANAQANSITIVNDYKYFTGTTLTIDSGQTLTVSSGSGTVDIGTTSTELCTNGSNNTSLNVNGTLLSGTITLTPATSGCQIYNSRLTVGASGGVTINGNLTGSDSGGTASVIFSGAGTINLTGNFNTSHFTSATGSTVNYNGSGAQTVGAYTYSNLTLSGSGTKSLGGNIAVSGTMTVNSGTTLSPNAGYVITGTGGSITGQGTIQVTGSSYTFQYSGFTTNTLSNMTVDYAGAGGQTINSAVGIYGALKTSNSGTRTLDGAVTVNGDVTIGSGTTLDVTTSNFALSVGGNWSRSGTFTQRSGTVTFNGTSAQTIGGSSATTFNNLTISNPTSVTLTQAVTVSTTLSVTSGIFNQGTVNLSVKNISVNSGATYRNRGTGSLTLGNTVTNSGTIDFFGNSGQCSLTSTSMIHILSDQSGLPRTWYGSGTFNMVDVDVKDQARDVAQPNIQVYAGFDRGDNTKWTFNSTCSGLPTAIKLASFTVTDYSRKVLLQWLTGYEVDNLGFNLYREENGQLIRLNPSLIAGSALLVRGAALTAGLPYQWWDTSLSNQQSAISYQSGNQPSAISGQTSGSSTQQSELGTQSSALGTVKYWLEDIDLKGKHTMHGPVTPVVSNGPLPQTIKPEFLSELGKRLDERYEELSKIQELKRQLRQTAPKGGQQSALSGQTSALSTQSSSLDPQSSILNPQSSSLSPSVSVNPAQTSQQDLSKQWSLADGPAVKISVNEEGWYRVGQPDLVKAGLNPGINPKRLQLYMNAVEQPIHVIGQDDKQFGPQDAIEFYGTGLDTLSTDTHVYWLIAGSKAGKRVQTYMGGGPSSQTASFPYTVERKDRTTYFPALMNGDEDNFFGDFITGAAEVDQLLTVVHTDLAASGAALLEVSLQGVTLVPHKVQILFNEVSMGELDFDGQSKGVIQITIPQSGIPEGSNVVTLIAQGGGDDISLVDHVWLTYWHTYTADQDFLKFTAQGGKKLSVGGFSSENIRVMDITDPGAVVEVIDTVNSQGTGSTISYAMTFGAPGSGQRSFLAFTDPGEIGYPAAITANQASTWHGGNNGADLVMIAHKQFLDSVRSLKALRTSQGWSVALINVEDLYDEFNFGAKSPQALKDFLKLAKNQWRRPPRFVLLVGDASYDPRDYQGWSKSGKLDYVPTKLVGTAYQETASDDWFVDFNGDGLPEMAVGRLPVRTTDEATVVVNKIVGYEQSAADAWARRVVLVADVDPNQQFDFQMATIPLEGLIPTGFGVQEIFRSKYGSDADAKADILDSIDEADLGALVVNFIGHGTVLGWGGAGGLLSAKDPKHPELPYGDVSTLTNGLRLPFFISMTCLNGFFQAPYADTLAESLLKAGNGGGIAVWASSGMTEPEGQATLNQALIQLLFNRKGLTGLTLGEATVKAKAAVTDMDIRRSWILFGDPTLKLK